MNEPDMKEVLAKHDRQMAELRKQQEETEITLFAMRDGYKPPLESGKNLLFALANANRRSGQKEDLLLKCAEFLKEKGHEKAAASLIGRINEINAGVPARNTVIGRKQ